MLWKRLDHLGCGNKVIFGLLLYHMNSFSSNADNGNGDNDDNTVRKNKNINYQCID